MTIVATPSPMPTCAAHALTAEQRLALALDSLNDRACISRLAQQHDVSRKFVYQQQRKAQQALQDAFDPAPPAESDVLFRLDVTRHWLRQFALVAALVGHASVRGIPEMLDCLFDFRVSPGWVHAVGTIADGGKGLRSGARQALPFVACDADVWHCLRDAGEAVRYPENRAYDAIAAADKARRQSCRKPGDETLRQRAETARFEQDEAIALADDVALLLSWLRRDVPGVAGPPLWHRQEAFDFVLVESMKRRASCEHRLGPVCSLLDGRGRNRWVFAGGWIVTWRTWPFTRG